MDHTIGGDHSPGPRRMRIFRRPPEGERQGPVLVALGSPPHDWHALEWAAAEAQARQCALRIVHVFMRPLSWDAVENVSVVPFVSAWQAAEQVVAEAAARVRGVAPDLPISTHLQEGAAAAAILREGSRDALIVVGQDRAGHSSFARSVGWQVACHAGCPVAIVEPVDAASVGPSAGRVVVGVDRTGGPKAVLGFAFRAARFRGVGLTVLYGRSARGIARRGAMLDDPAAARSLSRRRVENAVRRYAGAFPDVQVQWRLAATRAGPALVAESVGAALVVVGSGGHGRLHRALYGSVHQEVLHSASSSVVIVQTRPPNRRNEQHES